MSIFIKNVQVVFPNEKILSANIRFADGKVDAIDLDHPAPDDEVIDGAGRRLTPGLVDLHVHGILRHLFGTGANDLLAASRAFAQFGTTTVLPTVLPRRGPDMLSGLAELTDALDKIQTVKMPGFHLEGPFMALPGAGCDVIPGDAALLSELLDACRQKVRVMSLSPDTPHILPVIERLRELGITPFVTHTRATLEQTRAAIAAGARHATHFYDVFPVPEATDPGVRPVGAVEAFLFDPDTTVDFIADGCHVNPLVIQLAVRLKTCAGVAVITDGNIGAGLPASEYPTPWGFSVRTKPGDGARIADPVHPSHGALAGSALTMNAAMANVFSWLDEPAENVWAMGTSTPARVAGLTDAGSLRVGQPADAVLWQSDLTPAMTWVDGEAVFSDGTV